LWQIGSQWKHTNEEGEPAMFNRRNAAADWKIRASRLPYNEDRTTAELLRIAALAPSRPAEDTADLIRLVVRAHGDYCRRAK
jgi:hypothetical protein